MIDISQPQMAGFAIRKCHRRLLSLAQSKDMFSNLAKGFAVRTY